MKIAITTRNFGQLDPGPLDYLKLRFDEIIENTSGGKPSKEDIIRMLTGAAGVLAGTEKLNDEIFTACPELKVISRCGVGLDSVDLEAARKRGIVVLNTPGVLNDAVAELAVGLMLSCLRNITQSDREIRGGGWKPRMGGLLSGKTVGVIGFGGIGRRVAEIASAFKADVLAYDPVVDKAIAAKMNVKPVSVDEIIDQSDIITIHTPLTAETKNIVSRERIAAMKKTAILINTSRGGVVDDAALIEALKERRIAGAGLDVFEKEPPGNEFFGLDNVTLTAHIGSYAREARVEMEWASARNLARGLGLEDVEAGS